ncbi:hypothetical protein MMC11_004185 [Xylographa trunciseda]|nr:hypothetical protein [Xylographa trunciseda]
MEMPNELAEPLKGVIGDVVFSGAAYPDPDGAPVPTGMLLKLLKTLGPAEEAGMAALFDETGAAATVTVDRIVVGMQVLIVMTEIDGAAEVAGRAAFIEVGTITGLLAGIAGIEGAAAVEEGTEGGVTKVTVKVEVEVEVDERTDTGATVGLETA